ncbi:MAG TPA: hypothetical protein VJ997_12955, partial [Longimicrobiales bacterium]|nr:hypothetical protein [Longimicrobiales bacterium]
NPGLAARVTVLPRRAVQAPLAGAGAVLLAFFLGVHVWKDLTTDVAAWYFHSTVLWLVVMALGSLIYLTKVANLRRSGVDLNALFSTLPPE